MDILKLVFEYVYEHPTLILLAPFYFLYRKLNKSMNSYFDTKGKNFADKEDLSKLTLIVEEIKTEQSKALEEFKFESQRKLHDSEREKNLKKEIYLDAIESLNYIQNSILSLSSLEVDTIEHASIHREHASKASRSFLVGSQDVINSIQVFLATVSSDLANAYISRVPLQTNYSNLLEIQKLITESNQRKAVYFEKLGEISQNQQDNISILTNIQAQIDTEDGIIKGHNDIMMPKLKINQDLSEELLIELSEIYNKCFPLLADVLISIRHELHLPIDEIEFKKFFNFTPDNSDIEKRFEAAREMFDNLDCHNNTPEKA